MNFLDFNTYEDYVDSFITLKDVRYLSNIQVERNLILNACGKNCLGGLLTRAQFEERRDKAMLLLKPRGLFGVYHFSDFLNNNDKVLQQLALREKKLIERQLSTVIYLQMRSQKGLEVSSFIDLEQSLRESRFKTAVNITDWRGVFEGTKKLMPGKHHLSYFAWNRNRVQYNDSDNFRVVNEGAHSLLLKHVGDHKIICVNATCKCPYSRNAKRAMYPSSVYGYVIFFDHIIRRIN
ncbi:uncharacterized protein Dana_GF20603 [Drosophila ananassae]|uniref:Cilia- and flagella-associated protein 299 n=1 Tax=Drosophila ananassae TaxID=7217 RepID=B3N1Z2_DROAN|nr:cilia- and flagella-associated protein 299 [Drosophila ananassae]EDV30602.1 uncharacterized protein Dana_GF20603 [Drosophila ananassae]KAH8349232.1 hypothetical protein KR067_002032 [Drosophila pandora]